jgi:hypothetical protein
MRKLLALSLLLVFCLGVGPSTNRVYPAAGAHTVWFHVSSTVSNTDCLDRQSATLGTNCAGNHLEYRIDRDSVIVSWGVALNTPWTTTESCDLGLEVDSDGAGGEVDVFNLGDTNLRSAGDASTSNIGTNIDAGELWQLTIDAPATNYCVNADGTCACASTESFTVWVRFLDR